MAELKGKEDGHEDDDHEHEHDPTLQAIENIVYCVIMPMEYVMPVKNAPIVAIAVVILLVYIMCEFILSVFNVFAAYTGLSHFFVGLTLMVWGSDVLEMINFTISLKNKQLELGMTSVLSCQLICLIVVIPLASFARMAQRGQTDIQIIQAQHSREIIVMPPLLIVLLSMFILLNNNMKLTRLNSTILMLIYFAYVAFTFALTSDEE